MLTRTAFVVSIVLASPALAADTGTHFLIEPYSGFTFDHSFPAESAFGLESGALLAIGGKLKSFPPRFYFYFRAAHTRFGNEELRVESRQASAVVSRAYTKVFGGLRTVIPLFWNLRLNLEIGGGGLFSENAYSESGLKLFDYREELGAMEVGLGLNLRLFRWLSVGVLYDYTFVVEKERGDLIANVLREAGGGTTLSWSHLLTTVGFHF